MKFQQGREVRLLFDIVSDGTVAGVNRGKMVMPLGSVGYIARIEVFKDDYVYNVNFLDHNRMVGCRGHELIDADQPWNPPRFQKKDRIQSTMNITREGSVVVTEGTAGKILTLDYHDDLGYIYEVEFDNATELMVAEAQIGPVHPSDPSSEDPA